MVMHVRHIVEVSLGLEAFVPGGELEEHDGEHHVDHDGFCCGWAE